MISSGSFVQPLLHSNCLNSRLSRWKGCLGWVESTWITHYSLLLFHLKKVSTNLYSPLWLVFVKWWPSSATIGLCYIRGESNKQTTPSAMSVVVSKRAIYRRTWSISCYPSVVGSVLWLRSKMKASSCLTTFPFTLGASITTLPSMPNVVATPQTGCKWLGLTATTPVAGSVAKTSSPDSPIWNILSTTKAGIAAR